MISVHFQGKPFNITIIQVYAPTANAKEAEVEWFYDGFPGGLDGKESACNVGHLGLIPMLGRSPRGGHGNPLENPRDRGTQQAIVHRVTKSRTRLSD